MKKTLFALTIFVITTFLSSCASMKDYGIYNPDDVPEEDLCTLVIHQNITISKIDDDKIDWYYPFGEKTAKIPSGIHTFYVNYYDGQWRSLTTNTVICKLEKGNIYFLKGNVANQRIQYQIITYNDEEEGADVTLSPNRPQINSNEIRLAYLMFVLNPTSDTNGNTIKLENDSYIILYKPDMVYSMTDKKTNKTTEGRWGFFMGFSADDHKKYLLETDITQMSKKEFLDGNYREKAQIVWVPIRCFDNEVTYRYEKPAELRGQEITFSITEIKP